MPNNKQSSTNRKKITPTYCHDSREFRPWQCMVLMTIILKEYLESRHRDRCVPSPTRENRQLAPKGLGGLAVNMVIMTVRMLRMTVRMTMTPMAGLKMTIVIMT